MVGAFVCLYVCECALLESRVYVLCYFSCMSFFLPILNMSKAIGGVIYRFQLELSK